MYLIHKFVNSSLITNCRIGYSLIYAEKRSLLSLMEMPNSKFRKISKGFSSVPNVQVQVVGSGAVGVPSTVVLNSGSARYLINCGEGSQKLGNEYRFGLEKISNIFITNPSWKNVSGILGLALSSQKSSHEQFVVHGHKCIGTIFSGINKFVNLRYMHPKLNECQHYEEFSDGNISVTYVHLHSSSLEKPKKIASESSLVIPEKGESSNIKKNYVPNTEKDIHLNSEIKSPHLNKKHANNTKAYKKDLNEKYFLEKSTESQNNDKFVISYIFHTPSTPGTLLIEKCVEFGVPPGPLLGMLKSGKDVILDNGVLVRSEDVKNPDIPGVTVIVVECPAEDYLDSLLKEPIYSKYQSGENCAAAVIHFSSSQVIKNPKYQDWINHFAEKTKHLFINENNKLTGSVSIHRQQFKLNYLQPMLFPLLHDAEIPDFPRAENSTTEYGHTLLHHPNTEIEPVYSNKVFYKCDSNSLINGETLCTLNLKPNLNYDYSKCLVLKKNEFLNEMFKNVEGNIQKCKKKLDDMELTLEGDKRIYPKIVFLGTGSGKPSKVRNASGILIFLEENKCILFDCGENTYNQLIIFYGKNKVKEILRNLIAIYISHLHIDHHMGLITLLKKRKLAFDEYDELLMKETNVQIQEQIVQPAFQPVFLLAPLVIRRWLYLYSEKFDDILKLFDLVPNSFLEEGNKQLMDKKENCKENLNLSSVLTTPVCHCNGSFGISIVHKNGWKITYSGDTRPCDSLVRLGMDSDILIHEATFEDAFAYEAKIKAHSTTSEAIDVGRRMNAKYILLTHFSQRYCYLPVIEDKLKNLNIGIAFDFMEVPFNKLPLLPAMLEPLQYIFSEYNTKIKTQQKFLFLKRKQDEANISSEESSLENTERSAKVKKRSLECKEMYL